MSCWEEQPRGPGVRAGVGPAGPRAGPGSAPWPPVLCGFSLGRNWVWSAGDLLLSPLFSSQDVVSKQWSASERSNGQVTL